MTRATRAANSFELWGKGIHLHYQSTGIDGRASLTYDGYGTKHSFRGDQLQVEATALGTQITVILRAVPDLETDTFTLIVPTVHLADGAAVRFTAVGVFAIHQTSIGGPSLVVGPLTRYDSVDLRGVARAVEF